MYTSRAGEGSIRRALAWLLSLSMMLASGWACAQARGESYFDIVQAGPRIIDEATRAAKQAEAEAWLRRLAGRFHYDGTATIENEGTMPATGMGDCVGVGRSPGIQCVIQVTWLANTDPTLAPAMFLYGIDSPALGIRYLQVNTRSIAEGALGFVNGNRATFKTDCVNEPVVPLCRRAIRIEAPAHGRLLWVWDDIEKLIDTPYGKEWVRVAGFMFSLRRVPPTGAGQQPARQRR